MNGKPVSVAGNIQVLSGVDGFLRSLVHRRLEGLTYGRLTVSDPWGESSFGPTGSSGPRGQLTVLDGRFYRDVLSGGGLGAAESYLNGRWTCDDLTSLFRLFVRNMELSDRLDAGLGARVGSWLARAYHWSRRNSRLGSRKNIREHYDLGNDLFALFLDPTMTYSAGIFEDPDSSMEQASVAKLDRICRKLDLSPRDHVLEIGTGWGSFAIHAAKNYGCRVTTTTVSAEQYKLARERVEQSGLSERIRLLQEDYRDLSGTYDKLVSIEMIEAVGHRFLPVYFSSCSRLLKPHGQMLLQAITLPDHRFDRALRSVDFIQHYIFPGSCVPSLSAMLQAISEASDLRVTHVEDIGLHYERTLRCWREKFNRNLSRVREAGYPDRFIRLWNYYLSYCEAGFAERYLGDLQLTLHKPACRVPPMVLRFTERI